MVEEYINGKGSSVDLGVKYNISSGLLRSWARMYNANRELKGYNPKREAYMAGAGRRTTVEERRDQVCRAYQRVRRTFSPYPGLPITFKSVKTLRLMKLPQDLFIVFSV